MPRIRSRIPRLKNWKRVLAGHRNRMRAGPLTEAQRQRRREAALRTQPWLHATGPRTVKGKARSAANGRRRQTGMYSRRDLQRQLQPIKDLLAFMRQLRKSMRSTASSAVTATLSREASPMARPMVGPGPETTPEST